MGKLGWCSHCREYSVVLQLWTRKRDNTPQRVEFCLNKGCGYRKDIPLLQGREYGRIKTAGVR